jgi:hypothetical protein
MNVLKKLLRDLRNWNIVNIQFIPFDEKKEQIQRSFEGIELNPVHSFLNYGKFDINSSGKIEKSRLNVKNSSKVLGKK